MEADEWIVGHHYENKHNGGTIRITERIVRDNGIVLWRAERISSPHDERLVGETTVLSLYDLRHWTPFVLMPQPKTGKSKSRFETILENYQMEDE